MYPTVTFESSHWDLMLKYLFGGGYLPGNCLSVRWYSKKASWKTVICSVATKVFLENRYLFGSQKRSAPGKSVSVRCLKSCSWKIGICSVAKKVLLENRYLFSDHIKRAPGKMVSVWRTDKPSWKIGIYSVNT